MKFKQWHCITIPYIIIFEIIFPQNNRYLFYLLNLAGIDHKTTMGRIAASSPTAEEQNKQSPSKPKITLHSPKHDIKSSFRSAGIQVQDQFVHGNVKKRVWGSQYCETLWLFYDYWWLVRVTLVVAWWLFAPKFWEVVGTYESLICSNMNAASVMVTCEVVGTLNHYKMVKKILNFVHLEVVGT